MRKLLKYLSFSLICLIANTNLFAQWCTTPNFISQGGGNQILLDSKYGATLPTKGTLRILLVFFEVNYDVIGVSDPAHTSPQWAAHTLPTWATPQNLLVDANPPSGSTPALLIADEMNRLNRRTVNGNQFFANSIKQLYNRYCIK